MWLSGLLAARRRPRQRPRRPGAPAARCRGPSGGHGVCVCVCVQVRPRSSRDFPSAPVPVLAPQRPFWSQTRRHSSLWLHSPAPGLLCAASAKGSWYENEARVPSGRKNAFHTHTCARTHAHTLTLRPTHTHSLNGSACRELAEPPQHESQSGTRAGLAEPSRQWMGPSHGHVWPVVPLHPDFS